jgi:hypothetical protein
LDRLEGGMHEGFVKIEDKSHLVLHLKIKDNKIRRR